MCELLPTSEIAFTRDEGKTVINTFLIWYKSMTVLSSILNPHFHLGIAFLVTDPNQINMYRLQCV